MIRRLLSIVLLLLPAIAARPLATAQDGPRILEFRGATMGTTYLVKVFDPPQFQSDIRLAIDAELRRVNDQMSTYLKSSELGRFNASKSTDWFDVSGETAMVVKFALSVSVETDGAFDVTVGPLVNAWSFGTGPRPQKVPDEAVLRRIQASVGYQKLSVRTDPPALRKSVADLQVDLSALAKGHGVDRVVELLDSAGAGNVFVEIGGEVRTSGDKNGQPWRVGIQLPDAATDTVLIGHPMSSDAGKDESMATSGDYRNFFEVDGKRYSHTIDPRTGNPVQHELASVSVVTASCMSADAWATAINVVGLERGLELADQQQLSVLLVSRIDGRYALHGTGSLAQHAGAQQVGAPHEEAQLAGAHELEVADRSPPDKSSADLAGPSGGVVASSGADAGIRSSEDVSNQWIVPLLACGVFGIALFAMAIGVVFGRRAISGSCGGLAGAKNEDGSSSCSLCSNPSDACKELRERAK